jgi:hypothetical protein
MTYERPIWEIEIRAGVVAGEPVTLRLRGEVTDQFELDKIVDGLIAMRPFLASGMALREDATEIAAEERSSASPTPEGGDAQ